MPGKKSGRKGAGSRGGVRGGAAGRRGSGAGDAAVVAATGGAGGIAGGRYPSTPHLPFSPEVHDDDIKVSDSAASALLESGPVVITEKLDGGNCCLRDGKVFARTHSHEATHASFSPIKELSARVVACGLVDEGVSLFGENMAGIHSIEYDDLESFFYLFGVRNADGSWLSWDAVEEMAENLGVPTAPVVYRGNVADLGSLRRILDDAAVKPSAVAHDAGDGTATRPEGFVVRVAGGFADAEFERAMAKYVRKGHVQTDASWLRTWKKAVLHAWRKRK